jgi:hypothetical protein
MTHEQTNILVNRALAAFWKSVEKEQPQSMYHAIDEDLFYELQNAAFKAINLRLTGSVKE